MCLGWSAYLSVWWEVGALCSERLAVFVPSLPPLCFPLYISVTVPVGHGGSSLVKNFTGSLKIFKDLLEDLGEDLCKDLQQRSLKILKDPNFSCQDPQKSLQRSSWIFKDLQRSSRIFEDLCKIFKDL